MSGAWTFQDIGKDDAAAVGFAEKLYGDDGMRLDVVRYNVGAGTKELENGYEDGATRATESFFIAENYNSPASFSDPENYDFTRDAAALNVLDKCLDTGNVRTVVLFANSPHYLLTRNKKGNADREYESNLLRENYSAFADYMLIIADFFREKFSALENPPEIYISPVNEPQWKWGGEYATQEGCHFEPAELAEFYDVFYTRLCAYNKETGADIKPDFFESGNYGVTGLSKSHFAEYIAEFSRYDFFSELGHLSVHSYGANNGRLYRSQFNTYMKTRLPDLKVHMSEYCVMQGGLDESIDMGIYTAGVMMKDLTMISASQWCWWLGAATCGEGNGGWYEDGLLYYTADDGYSFFTTKRYFTLSQFTRYISAGDVRIKARTNDINGLDGMEVCAFEKPDKSVSVVLINHRSRTRKLKLPKGFRIAEASVTDADRNLADLSAQNLKIPANCVLSLRLVKE